GIRDYKVTGVQTCALPISGKAFYREEVAGNGEPRSFLFAEENAEFGEGGEQAQRAGAVSKSLIFGVRGFALSLTQSYSGNDLDRSEERRVGKECICRWRRE